MSKKKQSFNQWLKKQVKRNDPIGDLARDAANDSERKPRTLEGWRDHLYDNSACDGAFVALGEAYSEWQSGVTPDTPIPAGISHNASGSWWITPDQYVEDIEDEQIIN